MNNYGKHLVAHRGFSHAYPENTFSSVEAALALGACFVEVDVHLSADHVPIVIHDASLKRTAGKRVNVMDTLISLLPQYSVHEPRRFADRFLPQRIPTLQDILDLFAGHPGRTLFIEAKRASIVRFGIDTFLNAMAPLIEALPGQCVLISFHREFLVAAKNRRLCPVGWVMEKTDDHSVRAVERLQPEYVFTGYAGVPARWEHLPQGTWQWAVYTIDEAELALQWFQRGATLVETNNFAALIKHPSLNSVCQT
jgi:glycerophosphoryl diester phosphodiesterase